MLVKIVDRLLGWKLRRKRLAFDLLLVGGEPARWWERTSTLQERRDRAVAGDR